MKAREAANKIIWVLTVTVFASFIILCTYSWGKYVFFGCCVAIYLLSIYVHHGRIYFKIGAAQWMVVIFAGYTLLSSLWAIEPMDSVYMARTLIRTMLCAYLVYLHYAQEEDIGPLLRAIKWSGFIVALYSIYIYGFSNLISASMGAAFRMKQIFANQNDIGMAVALSCVFGFSDFLYDKNRRWEAVMLVPSIIVVAATQSRNAFFIVLAGVFGIVTIKNWDNKKFVNSFVKTLLSVVIVILGIYLLSFLDLFKGIIERFESLFSLFTGEGEVDNSTFMRTQMIIMGIDYWKKYPILGIGMANPHLIVAQTMRDMYMHSNFIELLCGGGIVGIMMYYSMFVVILVGLIRYRDGNKRYYCVCLTWLAIMFFMDLGTVSYYDKSRSFYLMVQFLNVFLLKNQCIENKERARAERRARARQRQKQELLLQQQKQDLLQQQKQQQQQKQYTV